MTYSFSVLIRHSAGYFIQKIFIAFMVLEVRSLKPNASICWASREDFVVDNISVVEVCAKEIMCQERKPETPRA